MDWLSRLLEMMPVRGRLDLRCSYGAPWRIDQGPGEANEIPYHAVLAGSATLEDPAGGRPLQLKAGDILLLPRPCRPAIARPSISRSAKTWVQTNDSIYCADTSPSRRRMIACCAAICHRALSCMPALTLDSRKRPRNSLASCP